MILTRILPFCRNLLSEAVQPGSIAVDATAGNGHDSVFLAALTGEEGHVFSFDIQQEAIDATRRNLEDKGLSNRVTLFHKGHEFAEELIPDEYHGNISGAVFNLGYLPGGNKEIVTSPEGTIESIRQLFRMLKPEGIIVLVIYHGHPEGKLEKQSVLEFLQSLPQEEAHVMQYQFINQKNNPPFICAIEKR
ncbi:methyltransferase domain-containing protein [Bacillus sp. FJAT-42376]|uniref:class I SAM-dependent methyltransferase n=1 Tax=Bacillus sp. FJAT-42376 TaxID=2014076 RepID=UPI000F51574C|nr:class I SAM-dependent methyltransferase [Bacillus sp. FJAT-42376]AZB44050.1 methyltransferase domain-containing protein [Bacillus sp. FJAT-42376]